MLLNFNIFAKCLSTNKFSHSLKNYYGILCYDFNLENMVSILVDELLLTTQLCPESPPPLLQLLFLLATIEFKCAIDISHPIQSKCFQPLIFCCLSLLNYCIHYMRQ